ncbi:Protein N-terminal amidase [Hondaea fermentalgiana]|uniref:Protein N-terminal amidase n=1 Tax=Hondaea fermentalgiana TaxID=2315210 RepID=A0A2R5GGH5_9STRA|nr:Protein N-terminal amidase [Hondaea fermentalgiana]|eukprot:GBG26954.1 Protein N-terminal amidase [Hondaea fermentalgiana]
MGDPDPSDTAATPPAPAAATAAAAAAAAAAPAAAASATASTAANLVASEAGIVAPPAPPKKVATAILAALQLGPVHGDIKASMAKADAILSEWAQQQQGSEQAKMDLLVLPEMAFTGYQFRAKDQVAALAEVAGQGPTFDWCCRVAAAYGCGVCVGFPRRDEVSGNLFNSVMLVSPAGALHAVYDKHFLYGFKSVDCDWLAGGTKVGLGICMDINPWEFKSKWQAYEFAHFHKAQASRIVAFASAWCNRHPDDIDAPAPNGPDTINYWFARLSPLLGHDTVFIAADRVGKEPASLFREDAQGDVTFCGSSCIIDFHRPALLGALDTAEEGIVASEVKLLSP